MECLFVVAHKPAYVLDLFDGWQCSSHRMNAQLVDNLSRTVGHLEIIQVASGGLDDFVAIEMIFLGDFLGLRDSFDLIFNLQAISDFVPFCLLVDVIKTD